MDQIPQDKYDELRAIFDRAKLHLDQHNEAMQDLIARVEALGEEAFDFWCAQSNEWQEEHGEYDVWSEELRFIDDKIENFEMSATFEDIVPQAPSK